LGWSQANVYLSDEWSQKMRLSRLGILVLILITVLVGTNCSYYNQIIARKDLVDGSKAYKDRKFQEAENLFRAAVARDPDGKTTEGQTAQLFLARTLHSEYIGNRGDKSKADDAIKEYKKALQNNNNDQSSYKAIASLYENLGMTDDWLKWVTARSNDQGTLPQYRAEALTSLAAKQNTCANDITDTDQTKKTITVAGKKEFQFVKPANADDFTKLKQCVDDGTRLVDQALALETDQVKNAKSLNVKGLTDEQLKTNSDQLKVFESARSYKASLTIQAMRVAEMEGRTADRDKLKSEAETAKQSFLELSEVVKNIQGEIDDRAAAKEAANNPEAANATKK
jgi:hypothetical protein